MVEVLLGLGSNLGNRRQNLATAIECLEQKMTLVTLSSIYESEPMYLKDQPEFLNCVAKFQTELRPDDLLAVLHFVEKELGRERRTKFGPRTIDLDILFYDSLILETPGLRIPHPLLRERLFVL